MVGPICGAFAAGGDRRNRIRTINEVVNEMTNTPIATTNPNQYNGHPVIGKRKDHQPEAIASRNQSKHADHASDFQNQFGFHNYKALPSTREREISRDRGCS